MVSDVKNYNQQYRIMLQLYIDKKPAVIKSGTQFKLTRVNPYFDSQGDFTFEVQLPLKGCAENCAIFGAINRPEMEHAQLLGKKYEMQLIAPPISLNGYAIIISNTDESVKVQLVAGNGALCNVLSEDERYIDKMNLGNAWDSFKSFSDGADGWDPGHDVEEQLRIFHFRPLSNSTDGAKDIWYKMAFGNYRETDSLCFPIYSTTDEKLANPWSFFDISDKPKMWSADNLVNHPLSLAILAPQPYLLDIAKRIVRCAGYSIGNWEELENNPLARGLFIANARGTIERAKTLPHWTIKEFLNNVQNLLGCIFVVNGKTVSLKSRSSYYLNNAYTVQLHNVISSRTISFDDEDSTNKSTTYGNVDYNYPTIDSQLRLPDEVWANAQVLKLESYHAIQLHFSKLKKEEQALSKYLYVDASTEYVYAILHQMVYDEVLKKTVYKYVLQHVDQFAPLIRTNNRESINKLNFAPTMVTPVSPSTISLETHGPAKTVPEVGYPALCTSDTVLVPCATYSVDVAINPSESDDTDKNNSENKKDVMELAWYDGEETTRYYLDEKEYGVKTAPCPISIPYMKATETNLYVVAPCLSVHPDTFEEAGPFALRKHSDEQNYDCIGSLLTKAASIDTRLEHQIQFFDDVNLDPSQTLLINNRRFAIHKIELTISADGVEPLKQCYCYEIN